MSNRSKMARLSAHLTWIAGLALLTLFFDAWLEQKNTPTAYLSAAMSGSEVVLASDGRGHYTAPGRINETPVRFIVDTGATYVSLSSSLAQELGLASQGKGFAETANGRVSVDYTLLDSVRLGGIEMQNVEALITPGMAGDSVLLGMSFLQHLQLSQHKGVLTLRVP